MGCDILEHPIVNKEAEMIEYGVIYCRFRHMKGETVCQIDFSD